MPLWYYNKSELKRTPSLADGIGVDVEQRYRREGARFIINVGTRMGLRYDTMATGVVYFHRFYMFHSFRTFPRFVTACCCLFLAGKVEETPKKCKDIIKTARALLTDQQFTQFGDDPKEEVMTLERILLQTIKFDLQVDHPYGYLLRYAKSLKGEKTKLQKMVQMAWTFVNDSLCTTLCLLWEPEIIGIALMYLAGKLSKFEVTDWVGRKSHHTRWWDMFVDDMSVELLDDICHQVLDLYSTPLATTPLDSPPGTPPTEKAQKIQTTPPASVHSSPPQTKIKEPVTAPQPLEPSVAQIAPATIPGSIIPVLVTTAVHTTDRGDMKQLLPPPPPPKTLGVSPSNAMMKPLPPPPMPPPMPMISEAEQPSRSLPNMETIPPPPPPQYNYQVQPPLPVEELFPASFGGPPPPPPSYQGAIAYQPTYPQVKNPISPSPTYPSGPNSAAIQMPIHQTPSAQYGSYAQHPQFYHGNESQDFYAAQGTSGYPTGQGPHNQLRMHTPPPIQHPPPSPHQFSGPHAPHNRPIGPGQFPGHQGMRMPPMQGPPRQGPPPPPNMGYPPNRFVPPMEMSPNSSQRMPGPRLSGRF